MADPVRLFFEAWGLTDGAAREAALDPVMADSFLYTDPNTHGPIESLGALCDYLGAFTARMPGAAAQAVSVDYHQAHARAVVDFTMNGNAMMRGQYFFVLDDLNRIERIAGFNGTGETT